MRRAKTLPRVIEAAASTPTTRRIESASSRPMAVNETKGPSTTIAAPTAAALDTVAR